MCAREIAGPRLAAARDPRARPLLRRRGPRAQHVYLREARGAARRPRRAPSRLLACRSSSPSRVRRIPVYPAADGYALAERRRAAGLQRVALPAAARGPRGGRSARCRTSTAIPTRRNARAARARCRDRYGFPPAAHRDRQRLVRHPARRRRGAARAGRRDRLRVAVVQRLPAPGGRVRRDARSRVPLDADDATTSTRCSPRSPPRRGSSSSATRTTRPRPRCRSSEIAAFLERVPRHVCVLIDEAYCEFNLLDDPDASLELLDRHPNLVLLRTFSKVYGLRGLRVGFALCGWRSSAPRSTRSASRSSATPPRRPRRSRRCATRTRSPRRVERPSPSALELEDGAARHRA